MYAVTIHSDGIAVKFNPAFTRGDAETSRFAAKSSTILHNGGVTIAIAENVSREALIEAKRIIDHYLTLN